jgi:hypothetical protein
VVSSRLSTQDMVKGIGIGRAQKKAAAPREFIFRRTIPILRLVRDKEEGSTVVGNCSATDKGSTIAITGTAAQHEGNDGGSGLCMTSSDHHEIAIFCRILLILADPIDPVSKAVRSSSFT